MFIASIIFFIFAINNINVFQKNLIFLVISFCLTISFFCFYSIKFNKNYEFLICILLSLFISLLNSSPLIKFGIIISAPLLLSLFCLSIKKTIFLSCFQIVGFFISNFFRAKNTIYVDSSIFEKFISLNIILLIEVIIVGAIACNFYNYLSLIFQEKKNASKDMLQFSLSAMEYHSKYLKIHNDGLRKIIIIILQVLSKNKIYKLTPQKCNDIIFAVQVHDIGKLAIDPYILDKPGKLSPEELFLIKQHPTKGLELFDKIPDGIIDDECSIVCRNIIYEHHERLDGKGYPLGKTDISIEGQIIAVADVVDALLSWRPYKNPFSFERVEEIITQDKGLNQEIVNIILDKKEEILKISHENNEILKSLFSLSDDEMKTI